MTLPTGGKDAARLILAVGSAGGGPMGRRSALALPTLRCRALPYPLDGARSADLLGRSAKGGLIAVAIEGCSLVGQIRSYPRPLQPPAYRPRLAHQRDASSLSV